MRRNGSDSTRVFRKQDMFLILFFLIIAAAGLLWLYAGRERGDTVQVTVDGTVIGEYPLERDDTIRIEGIGGNNTLKIRDDQADMTDADCPDKICVNHATISDVGESIVCLPHRVVVEIVSSDEETDNADFDVITR